MILKYKCIFCYQSFEEQTSNKAHYLPDTKGICIDCTLHSINNYLYQSSKLISILNSYPTIAKIIGEDNVRRAMAVD